MSADISIFLLICIITTVNGDIRIHEGENIIIQCGEYNDKPEIKALWKKETGQRVIWKNYGNLKKDEAYQNRTIDIDKKLSLVIKNCKKSDQGVYILCINEKPSCDVRLFVEKSKKRCKRSSDSCREKLSMDETGLEVGDESDPIKSSNRPRSIHFNTIFVIGLFLFVISMLFALFVKIKHFTKNNKSNELKILDPA